MRYLSCLFAIVVCGPALAASGPFISLNNTDFIVLLAFILFLGVLVYFKVPSIVFRMLDKRADAIRIELNEARKLREEAQSVLAGYERRQKEVREQAARIIDTARLEAESEAERAREALEITVERRLAAAEEKIASAKAGAERDVRDKAIKVAVSAARSVISAQMTSSSLNVLIDKAISNVDSKLS